VGGGGANLDGGGAGERREVTNPSTNVLEQDEGRSDQAQKIDMNLMKKKE